ncbi:MAG: helix-turn-helix domain-containing protein [Bacteriovorax sp.]|jgi:excisionase family DNA binding protein
MPHKLDYKKSRTSYNNGKQRKNTSATIFKNTKLIEKEDETENWLNTDEAAAYLSITPNALRILVHRARVKYYKLGRRLKFRRSDLIQILQQMEV